MTKNIRKILAFAVVVLAVLFPGVIRAQAPDGSREQEEIVIDRAKKYLASDLDPEMPAITLDLWLREIAGINNRVIWQIAGCTPTGAIHKEGEPPWLSLRCVDASVHITRDYFIHVFMEYGRFEPGVAPTSPALRRIFISDDYYNSASTVRSWREMPKIVRSIHSSLVQVDPNHAQFTISGRKPAGFEGLSLYFHTLEFGEYFEMKTGGEIETDDRKHYVLKNISFDGERFSFKTAAQDGVSYSFAGRFLFSKPTKNELATGKYKILRGRFIRIVNGRKAADAVMYFDYTLLGDFG